MIELGACLLRKRNIRELVGAQALHYLTAAAHDEEELVGLATSSSLLSLRQSRIWQPDRDRRRLDGRATAAVVESFLHCMAGRQLASLAECSGVSAAALRGDPSRPPPVS